MKKLHIIFLPLAKPQKPYAYCPIENLYSDYFSGSMKKNTFSATRFLILAIPFLVSGCGDTRAERAGSGAVIGGVTGIAVGMICCADPFDGAQVGGLIGAGAGAAIGAISNRPLFFNHESQYWPYDSTQEQPPQ
jgi:hypothetical protein